MDHDGVRAVLGTLDIPYEAGPVLGIWPTDAAGGWEVHLAESAFWRVVRTRGLAVTSTEHQAFLLRHAHRFTHAGIDFLTYTAQPVLPPGTVTSGYALRLT